MAEVIPISHNLSQKLRTHQAPISRWEKPEMFDLNSHADRAEVERRLDSGNIAQVVDRLPELADDLFEMHNPSQRSDERARQEYVEEVAGQGERYGNWFHFSWSRSLIRYPDQNEYQELRTFRNKNLITAEEQQRLLGARAVVFGLSVGSNVLEQLVQSGIGGTVIMGDFDRLSPTNLNRIIAGAPKVGMKKIDIAAIKISELDPYIEQRHFPEGVSEGVLDRLAEEKPDIIFDEVDDLAMKALMRRFAARERVPLMMATDIGDTSLLDVERYDTDPKTKPFHGKLKDSDLDQLISGEMSETERRKLMIKIVGARHVSPRMLQSAMQIDKSLGGMPQLGATAAQGGSLAAVAAREVLLDRKLNSGRYVSPMRKTLELQHVTSFRESVATIVEFVRSERSS